MASVRTWSAHGITVMFSGVWNVTAGNIFADPANRRLFDFFTPKNAGRTVLGIRDCFHMTNVSQKTAERGATRDLGIDRNFGDRNQFTLPENARRFIRTAGAELNAANPRHGGDASS